MTESTQSISPLRQWEALTPHLGPVNAWDWNAVARHLRRLRSALRNATRI
jgi:hypothetical protein